MVSCSHPLRRLGSDSLSSECEFADHRPRLTSHYNRLKLPSLLGLRTPSRSVECGLLKPGNAICKYDSVDSVGRMQLLPASRIVSSLLEMKR